MKTLWTRLSACLLALLLVVTGLPITFAAAPKAVALAAVSDAGANPVYEEADLPDAGTFRLARRYYSGGEVAEEDYLTTEAAVAEALRAGMKARENTVVVYFATELLMDAEGTVLNELNDRVLEAAFAETDDPAEGDYLRYAWTRYGCSGDGYSYEGDTTNYYTLTYTFQYFTTKAQEEAFDAAAQDLVEDFGFSATATDRQKIDTIYDYMTGNITYDYHNLNDDSYTLKFTAYAALMHKTAVCEGYAVLFYRLAEMCGLDARVITGSGDNSRDVNHAWNIVRLGGAYYYLDATWDADRYPNREYYLKGSADFLGHTNENKFNTEPFITQYPVPETGVELGNDSGFEGGFYYNVANGIATITQYEGTQANLVVPATLGGYPVKRLSSWAIANNDYIKKITFSEGIVGMDPEALIWLYGLEEIHYPSTMKIQLERYGDGAMGGFTTAPAYCENLKKITVAEGNPHMQMMGNALVTADGKAIIQYPAATGEKELVVPEGIEEIGPFAFWSADMEEIQLPDEVKILGYWAFYNCTDLKKVNIPTECTFIGQFAFSTTGVTEYHIPAGMDTILTGAFGSWVKMNKVTVDPANPTFAVRDGILCAGSRAIKYLSSNTAKKVTIPSWVESLDQHAFAENDYMEMIVVPETVTSIEAYAFEECDNLSLAVLPAGLEKISDGLFSNCSMLASVTIYGEEHTFSEQTIFGNNYQITLYGVPGGDLETYAAQQNYPFKALSQFVCEDGHQLQRHMLDTYSYYLACTVCGDRTETFWLKSMEGAQIFPANPFAEYKYTGQAIKPAIDKVVWNGEEELVEGRDYEIAGYQNNVNVGLAQMTLRGIGEYGGTLTYDYWIAPGDISTKTVKLSATKMGYTGKELKPKVTISGLKEGTDFTVSYSNNVKVGTATVTVTGKGNYEGQKTAKFTIFNANLPAPSTLTPTLYGHDDINVSWKKVSGATGYYVYYKKSSASSYTYAGETTSTSYKLPNMADNTKYSVRVRAYCKVDGTTYKSTNYKYATISTLRDLKAPSSTKAVLYGYDDVQVSWKKVSYAKGYYVYYKKSGDKSYTYAGKTTGTSYKKANLSDGKKYTFKVVPYGLSGSKVVLDSSYSTASVYTLKTVSTPSVSKYSSKKVKVKWTNISGESGYQISQSTSKSKTNIVATYSTTSGKSKTITAKKGKTYYYKVRAYKTVNGKKIYGPWSSVKSYKLK